MKCEDFLPDLETGSPWRRMQARRHAVRCPRCAAVYAALTAAKARLATPEPVSPRARELWNRAARSTVTVPDRRRRWVPAVACLVTAACLLIIFVGPDLWVRPNGNLMVNTGRSPDSIVTSPVTVSELDPVSDLSQLDDAASQLDAQLNSLRATAQRLAARR